MAGLVEESLAVDDIADVGAADQELHDLLSLTRQRGEAGGGVGVLLEPAEHLIVEREVDLAEPATAGATDFVVPGFQRDRRGVFHQSLSPDRDERRFQGHRWIVNRRRFADLSNRIGRVSGNFVSAGDTDGKLGATAAIFLEKRIDRFEQKRLYT